MNTLLPKPLVGARDWVHCELFCSGSAKAGKRGFTLIEVLLAVVIFSIVLVAIHTVFYGAIQLRNKTTEAIEKDIPKQQAFEVLKKDIEHLLLPVEGGTFTGELQTTLNATSSSSSTNSLNTLNPVENTLPGQSGPAFYTSSGIISDEWPWGEIQRVYYYLAPPTNNLPGKDLVRSVTRNLLPVLQEMPEEQRLMSGLQSMTFLFYDGTQWRNYWDSTTESNKVPYGIKVELEFVPEKNSAMRRAPLQLIFPIIVQSPTNQVSQTSSSGGQG